MNALDQRERHLDDIDSIKKTALDPYATFRSLYRQHRQAQIDDAPQRQARHHSGVVPAIGHTGYSHLFAGRVAGLLTEATARHAEPPHIPGPDRSLAAAAAGRLDPPGKAQAPTGAPARSSRASATGSWPS